MMKNINYIFIIKCEIFILFELNLYMHIVLEQKGNIL